MDNIGYLLMNCARKLKYELNQSLVPIGLTVQQWAILQQLQQHGSSSAIQLSERLGMDKPTVSGIVKRLEAKGFVSKNQDPQDKRLFHLTLTEAGVNRYQIAKKISEYELEKFTKKLTLLEKQQLETILTILGVE